MKNKDWRTTETAFIRNNWLTMNDAKIALELNRTKHAVTAQRCRMRLTKYQRRGMDYYQKLAEMQEYKRQQTYSNSVDNIVKRMRHLIKRIENSENEYQRQKYIPELKKLSGL